MTVNTFFNTWKWPNGTDDTATSTFDIPEGTTNIDVPSSLTSNFRDFGFEIYFSNLSASDDTLTVQFFRGNTIDGLSAPNVAAIDAQITLDSTITGDSTAVFLRDIKNLDNEYLRLVITAPSGVTANFIMNVKAGTNAR